MQWFFATQVIMSGHGLLLKVFLWALSMLLEPLNATDGPMWQPPSSPVRSTINIHWGVVGGDLQKRHIFGLNHRWRIIYTDQETQAQRYSTPSKSAFIDLNSGYTKIYLDKGETSCQESSRRSAWPLTKLHVLYGSDWGVKPCPNKVWGEAI